MPMAALQNAAELKKKGKPAFLTTQSGEWNWSTH
jgi:hypothetical protein